jgi:hypothetical protein
VADSTPPAVEPQRHRSKLDRQNQSLRRPWIGFVYVSPATPLDIVESQEHIEHLAHENERLRTERDELYVELPGFVVAVARAECSES